MKCSHIECPYKDCNYHIETTGKYVINDSDKPYYLPDDEESADMCLAYLDV